MPSSQTLSLADRRLVAAWAADCASRVLALFEAEAPQDQRPRDAIARARAFARGELDTAGEIRNRFVAGRAARDATSAPAIAAARSAAQAAAVAHMGAHALGAAAYAAQAVALAPNAAPTAAEEEVDRQLALLDEQTRAALALLPPLGEDRAGPLGSGLLTTGVLGDAIRRLQERL
ncbi:putative immunity protein [Leifsonia shinshuensis]|uniref:Imm-5-like domain-containing protein n=1 Tax=Leifsonia shinshuensis TaxID=150026 RepID=A0A7G6YBF3_9MICO|nr:hypothetical protein [Leifsonia shinshuensis]QNE35818.1 hypothetical protein F1C12_12225 [Leifsonia shinshuensis]